MALTGLLGTATSRPGDIQLGNSGQAAAVVYPITRAGMQATAVSLTVRLPVPGDILIWQTNHFEPVSEPWPVHPWPAI